MNLDDAPQGRFVRKADVMEEAAPQEGVRQFLLIVAGDDDDRPMPRADQLLRLVDVEFHAVELAQQVVRKLDVGLVDFVDQYHRLQLELECLPEPALDDVITDVVDPDIAELRISQPRDCVVLIQSLLRLAGGFDVPLQQRPVQRECDLLRQLGFAGARLALDQQRTLQDDRRVDGQAQILGGDVTFGTAETSLAQNNAAAFASAI